MVAASSFDAYPFLFFSDLTWKCYAQGVPRNKSNITVSFTEHLKVQEKMILRYGLWVNSGKSKQKN